MNNFYEELEKYFQNTSKEDILKDWSKYDIPENNIGPTMGEFINSLPIIRENNDLISNDTKNI